MDTDDIPERSAILGAAVRKHRRRLRMSQTDLAIRVGVSQPTVAHWEHGQHLPRPEHLTVLADVLQAPDLLELNLDAGGDRAGQPSVFAPQEYLERPIQHVPILAWPTRTDRFDPLIAPRRDHVAASMFARRPFALVINDPAMENMFPSGSVVVFEGADTSLKDGAFHLVEWRGRAMVRRWRAQPPRLEAAGAGDISDTLYPDAPPRAFGRVLVYYRVMDHAIRDAR